ncbi:phospholipase D-like domain-containing protein [Chryseobacterium gossypii]|uniref:phospholipase D-like domain-containing protein n=1 Tax=Chryseobacterium gossypii TaxID=3231602 RepID=UPI003525B93A
MELKFIGQGLNPESDMTAGNFIIDSLESEKYNSFNAFVAFVSTGGLRNIINQLHSFKENGGEIKLYCGVNLNATSKEALEQLLEHGIESYVVYSPNNIIYHPKIYAFEGNEKKRAIIGSSNLTESGLFQNIEASVCVDFDSDDENGNEFLSDIYDHFNAVINLEHPSCQLLTQEVLDILVESKVVLPEMVSRVKNNKINREFTQKEQNANTRLLQLFGKVKPKRPPKGFRKTVVKKEMVEEVTSEVRIVEETTELTAGAMWIETGLMTGGSRNILDLSKKGKLDGVNKFGSVSYFGIDPENGNETKDINIIFGGKTYISNRIFYTDGNSNWRIRLNGKTEDGKKLTTFSIPSLGQNGGFQNKILLFTKLNNDDFRLEILEQDDMPRLIENSVDWAKGGSGNGRAYGIIAE